jgi:dipeptidyl aminopeptidase/acylaminoacyl peptidase
MWLGRQGAPYLLMLLRHGYAVFMPNPRGSSGRGQAFARKVFGDPGGADASDLLAGLDARASPVECIRVHGAAAR